MVGRIAGSSVIIDLLVIGPGEIELVGTVTIRQIRWEMRLELF